MPECKVFAHSLFVNPLWLPFKQRVLAHVEAAASPTTHLQVALAADNAAVAALGTGMLLLNSSVDQKFQEVGQHLASLSQQITLLAAAAPTETLATAMRQTLAVALTGATQALQGGSSLPDALGAATTLLALPAGTAAVPPPPPLQPPPSSVTAGKPYIALGSISTVKRLYDDWFFGDPQTGNTAVKDLEKVSGDTRACLNASFD